MKQNFETALNQIRQQEEAGLNYIYAKTYNYVYLRAKNILKRESDIQKLMKDVYLKMIASASELREEQLYEWLGKCVYSLGCELYRKKKAREASVLEIEKSELEAVRKGIDLENTMSVIVQSMEELPDLYQATFYAFYYDYMPVHEIAEVMDCTEEVIINRLNYIRKYMIKALENFQEEKNVKVSFSVEAVWMALRKWSVEHCMGMTAAQSVYSDICKKMNLRAGAIYLEGKEFAGVNNTVVYHKADDFTPLYEQFEKYVPKAKIDNKKMGLFVGVAALILALIIGIVLFAGANKDKEGKKENVNQSQEANNQETDDKNVDDKNADNEDVNNEDTNNEDVNSGDSNNTDENTDASQGQDGEYILPESNTRALTRDDLKDLTKEQLRLARNEIFARHGMIFGVEDLDQYFKSKSWYEPTVPAEDFYTVVDMSLIEEENINLIVEVEGER